MITTTSTHLWVVVMDEVQVDPQLPHALKRISEPQTDNKNPKKTNSAQVVWNPQRKDGDL